MALKFCRSLLYDTGVSAVAKVSHAMKFMYEFWGFCINGTASLTSPGGFAATTPSTMPGNFNGVATTIAVGSNGATLPQATINVVSTTGFPTSGTIFVFTSLGTQTVTYTNTTGTTFTGCSGGLGTMSTGGNVTSSSLMTIGSDGYTNATTFFRFDGYQDFFAASGPFTSNMVGKAITLWKAGSNSSEDSIYKILAFKSATNIVINVNNGGTPSVVDGYKPSFTSRTSINYRVCDIHTAAQTTADGNYYVMQLDPTGINAGQANSQVKFTIAGTQFNMQAQLSPGGTWNGSAFTDGTNTINPNYGGVIMVGNTTTGLFSMNLIGDKDFLIYHNQWQGATYHNWMHLEIPERLYPQSLDPNPITISLNGNNSSDNIPFSTVQTNAGYGGGFVMKTHSSDGATAVRNHRTTVKALIGDGNTSNLTSPANTPNIPGSALTDFRAGANPITGQLLVSSGFLTLPAVTGQYALARVRLRRVRFANAFMRTFTRFQSNGDFILMSNGAALPWDKTILPYTLFQITG